MGVMDRVRERLPGASERRALQAETAMLRERNRLLTENGALVLEHLDELTLELAADEAGWRRADTGTERDWSTDRRRELVSLSRYMAIKNPLVRRQVRTQMAYVFGRGVEITARDEAVNEIVQAFLDDQRNARVLTSDLALAERERDLQTDGELFLALFVDRADFAVTVARIEPLQVEHVYCDPDDRDTPWYYLRAFTLRTDSGLEQRRLAYIDHRHAARLEADGEEPGDVTYAGHTWELAIDADSRAIPVMHVRVGNVGPMTRGLPETVAMLDWALAFKTWLEDWASIARSLARFAWRLSTTGDPARAAERLGTRLGTDLGETNPAPVAGSLFAAQPGTNLEPIRTAGAAPKAEDGLLVRKMAAAGSSFPDTILAADPDMGNLATARTLDRPTELTILMRQRLWADALDVVLTFVVAAAIDEGELSGTVDRSRGNLVIALPGEADPTVEIEFPPVLERDPTESVGAVVKAATLDGKASAGILPPRTIASQMLTALGVADQDEILAALFPDDDDPFGLAPAPPADDEAEAAEAALVAAARELREAFEGMAEADA